MAELLQAQAETFAEVVGRRLRGRRQAMGLGVTELAQHLDLKTQTRRITRLAEIEAGARPPGHSQLWTLQRTLRLPLSEARLLAKLGSPQWRARPPAERAAVYRGWLQANLHPEQELASQAHVLLTIDDEALLAQSAALVRLGLRGGVGLLYLGGRNVNASGLLQLWRAGLLQVECDCCSGTFYLTRLVVSPLSGTTFEYRGFCLRDRHVRLGPVAPSRALGHIAREVVGEGASVGR